MAATPAEPIPLPRRPRALVAALVALTAIAWLGLAWMAADADGMVAPANWSVGYWAAMFAMWAIMMAAMMVPSAAPTILLFAALRRHAGSPIGATASFGAGYLLAWTGFSAIATAAQWALDSTALISPAMASEGPRLSGALFLAAGLYQLAPFKDACLAQCRDPARFLVERARPGIPGALLMGVEHGAHCIGCCAALMALLFAFGVMNLMWVAALSAFVVAEKLLRRGRAFGRISGVVLAAAGIAFLFT